jgi:urea carboxylase-associated protein 1
VSGDADTKTLTGLGGVVYDHVVPAREPWSRVVKAGEILRIIDLEGQQAVDFLCYNAADPGDRYSSMNTIKVQGNSYVGLGTVLYSDSGVPLFTVIEDTLGRHDTIYGCCSNPNNFLRYGVKTTQSCYSNFLAELSRHGMDRSAIVGNVNFFMQVPVLDDGSAGIAADVSPPGGFVDLRAETDVLAVISNCPQMHNPCNAYNPTPIRVIVRTVA